ncbi:hypothetical protein [Streptomyces sp. NPDC093598]|uniref:hypothetical protein n=1 Tax=Streptomyces sp. NPDC093598 TaxID=3366046 RepID=UPI0038090121
MTNSTPPPTPTTSHCASLAAALVSATDRESRVKLFAELADETLTLAVQAPTAELEQFWGGLHEGFHADLLALREPAAMPKRRWFR